MFGWALVVVACGEVWACAAPAWIEVEGAPAPVCALPMGGEAALIGELACAIFGSSPTGRFPFVDEGEVEVVSRSRPFVTAKAWLSLPCLVDDGAEVEDPTGDDASSLGNTPAEVSAREISGKTPLDAAPWYALCTSG